MQEKRSHRRLPLNLEISCAISSGEDVSAIAKDISLGGAFLIADVTPPFGTEVVITAQLPGQKAPLEFPATVRWAKEGGFGIQFGLLGAKATHAITKLSSMAD